MENKKEMVVSAIENGTVIDHIPTNVVYKVISLLDLENYNDEVLIGNNLQSQKLGLVQDPPFFFAAVPHILKQRSRCYRQVPNPGSISFL